MKKIFVLFLSLFLVFGLFANPLEKALSEGDWTLKEANNVSTIWSKNDVTLEWCNKKNYHYVMIFDDETALVVDDYEKPSYESIANIKWNIIEKNRDPEVEWLEIKDGKLTGRKLVNNNFISIE